MPLLCLDCDLRGDTYLHGSFIHGLIFVPVALVCGKPAGVGGLGEQREHRPEAGDPAGAWRPPLCPRWWSSSAGRQDL